MNIGLRRTALVAAPLLAATSLAFVATPAANAAVSGNDDFAHAQAIPAAGGTVTGSNVDATSEADEPSDQDSGHPTATVWYAWTPTRDGVVSISTAGSDFDTFVEAYESGDTPGIGGLYTDGWNDDAPDATDGTSLLSFDAKAGQTYYIQVDGANDGTTTAGSIKLDVSQSASKIVGTVTGPSGAAAADICIDAYDADSGYEGYTTTDDTGHYTVDVLPGSYVLYFANCNPDVNLASAAMNDVAVGADATVTKNIRLVTGASIAGHVSTPPGAQFAWVEAYDSQGNGNGRDLDLSGNYAFNGLPSGSYTLHFAYIDADGHGHDLYVSNTTDESKATPVAITAGCAYHANADFLHNTTAALSGACTPACASAKSAATSAANALAAARGKANSDSQAAKKLKKKVKKAHDKAKTKLAKKLKKLKNRVTADNAAVTAATSASNAASAASTSACA